MRTNPINATLPQLLDRYRAAVTGRKDGELNDSIRLTYQSTAIEGSSLTLPQTRNLLQTHKLILDKPLAHQWQMIDHHQTSTISWPWPANANP